eukprot:snap_masked-scaffold_4-processed-gene-6.35-mRNA-1 protein AED:1.00 eAED:1.00 QI:0/0/0/0/1/1/2/0/91
MECSLNGIKGADTEYAELSLLIEDLKKLHKMLKGIYTKSYSLLFIYNEVSMQLLKGRLVPVFSRYLCKWEYAATEVAKMVSRLDRMIAEKN